MSLVPCTECGSSISSAAKACPKCGADLKPTKKKTSPITMALAIVLIAGMAGGLYVSSQRDKERADAEARKSPEQRARDAAADAADNARVAAAVQAMRAVMASAKNPDSVIWESVDVTKDAKAVCLEFRAQNSFGAVTRQAAVMAGGHLSTSPGSWNANCAGKSLWDEMDMGKRLLARG